MSSPNLGITFDKETIKKKKIELEELFGFTLEEWSDKKVEEEYYRLFETDELKDLRD